MIGVSAYLMHTVLTPDAEGAHAAGPGVALTTPASGAPVAYLPSRPIAPARQTTERAEARPLAAQIEIARRLNQPVARAPRRQPPAPPKAKPRPLATGPALTRRPTAESGLVVARIDAARALAKTAKAEIIDLVAARRARQIEATDREIAALFG